MTEDVFERWSTKVEIHANGCWVWTGAKDELGYGSLRVAGKNLKPYRLSYEHFIGPIPEGYELDHLCRNPSCVYAGHLEVVTHRENVLRGRGLTAQNALKTRCPEGHRYDRSRHRPGRGVERWCSRCRTEQMREASQRYEARNREARIAAKRRRRALAKPPIGPEHE